MASLCTILSSGVPRCNSDRRHRHSRARSHFHVLRRTSELDGSHDDAPLHTVVDGFSRKIENHMAAVAINYFVYNFIKIHSTLRTSPAMAAGVTDRLFDVMDLVKLLIESEREKPRSC